MTNRVNYTEGLEFGIGDRVRLVAGHTEMEVVGISCNTFIIKYVSKLPYTGNEHSTSVKYRAGCDIVLWETKQKETEEMTLYQTKQKTPRYGTKLAVNSKGQIVLEMKGDSAKVEAFDADKIEEVVPYTFQARSAVTPGHDCHYSGNEGDVSKGDILISNSGYIYIVAALNTKCKKPKKEFKGSVLSPTKVI